jgi:hypothetical protein
VKKGLTTRTIVIAELLLVGLPLIVALGFYVAGMKASGARLLLAVVYVIELVALLMPSNWVPMAPGERIHTRRQLDALMAEKRAQANRPGGMELLAIGPAVALILVGLASLGG